MLFVLRYSGRTDMLSYARRSVGVRLGVTAQLGVTKSPIPFVLRYPSTNGAHAPETDAVRPSVLRTNGYVVVCAPFRRPATWGDSATRRDKESHSVRAEVSKHERRARSGN